MKLFISCFTFLLLAWSTNLKGDYCLLARADVKSYISHLSYKHHFNYEQLEYLFRTVRMSEEVITHIKKPAEAKPWYEYRDSIVTQKKISKGLAYWRIHEKTLSLAEKKYGVPASIIVAILGIETKYGEKKGTYPVFNTLATLAFNDGRRANFFRSELTEYLLLSRENHFMPLSLKGSYAGAVGLPQFMPSSYRHYAVDFYGKGYADLFNNNADAIGSIGNYLKKHGWKQGEQVVLPAQVTGDCSPLYRKDLKPHLSEKTLGHYHIHCAPLKGKKVFVLHLQEATGYSYWLGLHNFYVISTYNKSELYVMAVNLLAQKIRELKYNCKTQMPTIPFPVNWQEKSQELECAL
jgi:membrane-bound lytic murein transglycosylase B